MNRAALRCQKLISAVVAMVMLLSILSGVTMITYAEGSAPGGRVTASSTQLEIDSIFGEGNATLSGTKITLNQDITAASSIGFASGTYTLDLNGYSITGANSVTTIDIRKTVGVDTQITITGSGSITGGNLTNSTGRDAISIAYNCSLTISANPSVTGGNGTTGGNAITNKGTLKILHAPTITGGAGTNTGGRAVSTSGTGSVTLCGGTYSGGTGKTGGVGLYTQGSSIYLFGGTISGGAGSSSVGNGNAYHNQSNSRIYLTDSDSGKVYQAVYTSNGSPVDFPDGTYGSVKNAFTVINLASPVARIGSTEYTDLSTALAAAEEASSAAGRTITIIDHILLSNPVPINAEIIIDLNDCTLTGSDSNAAVNIAAGGHLTIKGAGSIIGGASINNGGNAIINHGILTISGSPKILGGQGSYSSGNGIDNRGILTISGNPTLSGGESSITPGSGIDNQSTLTILGNPKVSGGDSSSSAGGSALQNTGTATLYGGIYTGGSGKTAGKAYVGKVIVELSDSTTEKMYKAVYTSDDSDVLSITGVRWNGMEDIVNAFRIVETTAPVEPNAVRIGSTEYATLDYALAAVTGSSAEHPVTIELLRDITASSHIIIEKNTYVKLTSAEGGPYTIHRGAVTSSLMIINGGAVLENIIIDGGAVWDGAGANKGQTSSAALVSIQHNGGASPSLTLGQNAVIQNNDNNNALGGGVYVGGGTFVLDGGTVAQNAVQDTTGGGGGVYVGTNEFDPGIGYSFHMKDGLITKNTARDGGGIFISSAASCTVDGGTITANTASGILGGTAGGGGISNAGTLLINRGDITENRSSNKGGGILNKGNECVLSAGTVSGNTADLLGQNVHTDTTFVFSGSAQLDSGIGIGNDMQGKLLVSSALSSPLQFEGYTLTVPDTYPVLGSVILEGTDGYLLTEDDFRQLSFLNYAYELIFENHQAKLAPPDLIAPILSGGAVSRISDTQAQITFTSDESGSYYYAVTDKDADEPVIDTNGDGIECTTTETVLALNDLTPGVKQIYIVVKDDAGNVSEPLILIIPTYRYAAKISDTEYAELDEAVHAAQEYSGDDDALRTVTILDNLQLSDTQTISGNVILNLNGYTLHGPAGDSVVSVSPDGLLTLLGAGAVLAGSGGDGLYNEGTVHIRGAPSIAGGDALSGPGGNGITTSGALCIRGSPMITGGGSSEDAGGNGIYAVPGAILELYGGMFSPGSGTVSGNAYDGSVPVSLEDPKTNELYKAVSMEDDSDILLTAGGLWDGSEAITNSFKIIALTCTCELSPPVFNNQDIELAYDQESIIVPLSASGSVLTGDCLISGHAETAVAYHYTIADPDMIAVLEGNILTINNSGTLSITVTAQANGKISMPTTAVFTVTRAPKPPDKEVAMVGDTPYITLEDAILAAQTYSGEDNTGRTVRLLSDLILKEVLYIDGSVILDLNGHTITGADEKNVLVIHPGGNLTVQGSGNITAGDHSAYGEYVLHNEGILTVRKNPVISAGNSPGGSIYNLGTLNLFGGTFIGNSDTYYHSGAPPVNLTDAENGKQYKAVYLDDHTDVLLPDGAVWDGSTGIGTPFEIIDNTQQTYTVMFDSAGGSTVSSSQVLSGDKMNKPPDPVKTNCIFAGWYQDKLYETVWNFETDIVLQDITLYAKWTVDSHLSARITNRDGTADASLSVTADNLYQAVDVSDALAAGDTVELQLRVDDQPSASNADKALIKRKASENKDRKVGQYFDLSLYQVTNLAEEKHTLTDNPVTITMTIPEAYSDAVKYTVARLHDGVVDILPDLDKDPAAITFETDRFSLYALLYTSKSSTSSGGGSPPVSNYRITARAGDGGSISPENAIVPRMGSQVFTITPDEGCTIADVLVDGDSVGAVTEYTFADVTADHTIEAAFKKTEPEKSPGIPYYEKDGNLIFVGFSNDSRYIAPDGVMIQYKENQKDFTDIGSHWGKEDIQFVTERELFLGTSKHLFSPDMAMTRGMFVTVMGRLYESSYEAIPPPDETMLFDDVSSDAYYAKYVSWAYRDGIVSGMGDGTYSPDKHVTREEMAAMIYRFAHHLGMADYDVSSSDLDFLDTGQISDWAINSVSYCKDQSIIQKETDDYFYPHKTATRAEVSAVTRRFIVSVLQ